MFFRAYTNFGIYQLPVHVHITAVKPFDSRTVRLRGNCARTRFETHFQITIRCYTSEIQIHVLWVCVRQAKVARHRGSQRVLMKLKSTRTRLRLVRLSAFYTFLRSYTRRDFRPETITMTFITQSHILN